MTRPLIDRIDFRSLFSADAMRIAESALRKEISTIGAAGRVHRRFVATAKTARELNDELRSHMESLLIHAVTAKQWIQVEKFARALAAFDLGDSRLASDLSNRLDD